MICGIPYTVQECDDVFDIDVHLGQIEYKDALIKINNGATEPLKRQTLCHEIVHGILIHLGYQEMSMDEQFVQSLAMAINQSFDVRGCEDVQKL